MSELRPYQQAVIDQMRKTRHEVRTDFSWNRGKSKILKDIVRRDKMKKIIPLFLVVIVYVCCFVAGILLSTLLWGCTRIVTAPYVPPVPVFNPEEPGAIKIALYNGTRLMLHDGNEVVMSNAGEFRNASARIFSRGDILEYFDGDGYVIHSSYLPATPEAVHSRVGASVAAHGVTIYSDEVWTLERIEPAEAYSLGAMYREYTRVYQGPDEIGAWYLNEWQVKEVVSPASGQIIAIDTAGDFHNLTDSAVPFRIYDNKLMIHDVDQVTNSGYFSDYTGTYAEDWQYNWFNSSEWQLADDVWYSSKGHTWSGAAGLIEESTVMWDFNEWPYPIDTVYANAPVIVPAAVRYDTGEECTFWVECNTGWLYRHIPSIDRLDMIVRLYQGDGERTTGVSYRAFLRPVYSPDEDALYFHDVGGLMRYDFGTGLVTVFSLDMEVWVW